MEQPTTSTEQPTTCTGQPEIDEEEHAIVARNSKPGDQQQDAGDSHAFIGGCKSLTGTGDAWLGGQNRVAINLQRESFTSQRSSSNQQRMAGEEQRVASDQQLATSDQHPTTDDSQPTTGN